jgi:hypothetical protein
VLNHPNIVAVYDVGENFLVSELVDGETLRDAGKLSQRQAIELAAQVAEGLAAAHAAGVTHRDLKPENIMVTGPSTSDAGRAKILDFGLAKVAQPQAPGTDAPTRTQDGIVMGTVGYMSPEQVKGLPVDHRSDIFSFGLVLYEMLAARRAFSGGSSIEVMSAILKEDAPGLPESVAPGLRRIVERCIEKEPGRRFQSARDLAFALENSDANSGPRAAVAARRNWRPLALGAGAALMAVVAYLAWARINTAPEPPRFQRLTFGHGVITSARVAPEGRTIVYTASWDGRPPELFTTRIDNRESRTLGIQKALIASISSAGEMALLLCKDRDLQQCVNLNSSVLARAPLAGGAPREILENVGDAEWTPDGSELAATHMVGGKTRVEFPVGNVVYETEGFIAGAGGTAVSPDGNLLAFAEASQGGNTFTLNTVNRKGQRRAFSNGWRGQSMYIAGWASARELFVAPQPGGSGARELYAADLAGGRRVLARAPGLMFLMDVTRDGRALVAQGNYRVALTGIPPGENNERDFSWLDASEVEDVSPDGRTLLITEFGDGGDSARFSIYLRKVDEALPVRLGEGVGCAISPDGTQVLSFRQSDPPTIVILPTGVGSPKVLPTPGMAGFVWAGWLPGGNEIAFVAAASSPGHPVGLYIQNLAGGAPRLIMTGLGATFAYRLVAPDGKTVVTPAANGLPTIYPLDGSRPLPVPGARPGDHPMHWSPDGKYYYFVRPKMPRAQVMKVELATGRIEFWKDIAPPDPAGLIDIYAVYIADDGKSYFYSYVRVLNDLYLVDGLK